MRLPRSALGMTVAVTIVVTPLTMPTTGAAPAGLSAPTAGVAASPEVAVGVAAEAHPVAPSIRTVAVTGVRAAGLAALPGADRSPSYAALTAPEPVSGVAVAGVTWQGATPPGLEMALRTRTDGSWTGWTPLVIDAEHGPDPGSVEADRTRPGTDPLVVGIVDEVQLSVTSPGAGLPRQLRLDLIDPGRSTVAARSASPKAADAPRPPHGARIDRADSVVRTATPRPVIRTRADWGADESLRDCCVEYGEVHAGFVHHTVNANDYTRAQTAAVIRGIYAYHTQGRGWRDIGYNFVIDRFGRIWEGRYGGVSLPVVGAHTLNYNENSFAASAIGNFETVQPRAALLDAYARLYAWKLSLHGVRPGTRQLVAGRTFNAISGHRDAAATACPGRYLYAKLPVIINKTRIRQRSFLGRDIHHSFVSGGRPDALLVAKSTGALRYARGRGAPGFSPGVLAARDFGGHDLVAAVGDLTGDGRQDLLARDRASRVTQLYPGVGDGTFGAATKRYRMWSKADVLVGPGDLDSDGFVDVLARDAATGRLLFYAGRGGGRFGAGSTALPRLGGATLVAPAGDFDRDDHRDLVVRSKTGALVLLLGTGRGTFEGKARLVRDLTAADVLAGGRDVTGDGRPDVVWQASARRIRVVPNVMGARLGPPVLSLERKVSRVVLSRDVTGDRRPDLVAINSRGDLVTFPGLRRNWLGRSRPAGQAWGGMNRVMIVGDWNLDGYVDAMARQRATAKMWLFPGRADGGFGNRVGGWGGWAQRSVITPVGDFDGDGRPDLLARAPNGQIKWYPGRGLQGFGTPRVARASGFASGSTVVSVGLWTRDGAPDVAVRTPDGRLLLYPGNGPGGLDEPRVIGRGFEGYVRLVGVGDLTGNGQPDLLARAKNGSVWLVPGRGPTANAPSGSFGQRRYVAAGWTGFLLA